MARPLRVEFDDAVYHVTARGNERRAVYRDDVDRLRFLQILEEAAGRFGVVVHAYCLMPNHYHLLVQTPRANLSQAIGWLQTTYTIRFNRRHGRSGHLMQGRFKAHLIQEDAYAKEVVRYVHLNPVRPRNRKAVIPVERRESFDAFPWSSHRAYAGLEKPPQWLCQEWLSYWSQTPSAARRVYRRDLGGMFGEVVPSPWEALRGGLVLGEEAYWKEVREFAASGSEEKIEWSQRQGKEELLAHVEQLCGREEDGRMKLWIAVRLGGRRMSELAREHGYADGSGVLRVVQRLEEAAKQRPELRRRMEGLRMSIGKS